MNCGKFSLSADVKDMHRASVGSGHIGYGTVGIRNMKPKVVDIGDALITLNSWPFGTIIYQVDGPKRLSWIYQRRKVNAQLILRASKLAASTSETCTFISMLASECHAIAYCTAACVDPGLEHVRVSFADEGADSYSTYRTRMR